VIPFYLVFLLLLSYALIDRKDQSKVIYYLFGITLIIFAAFRAEGIDNDYKGYIEYYDTITNGQILIVEPSFMALSYAVKYIFNNVFFIFLFYALLGGTLKLIAIRQLTELKFLTLLVYFSSYFLLFEMTQIRAGVAAGALLLCIKPMQERRLGKFLLFAFIAFLFHYSALVIFPLYFISPNKINTKLYLALVPAAYIMYFLRIDIFSLINYLPIGLIQAKISSYSFYAEQDASINLFNVIQIFRCFVALIFIWKWELLLRHNAYAILLIKIYILGLFVFVAFANIPGISSRISELLLVVEIILIPFIFYICKEKRLARLVITIIALGFLTFSLFYTKLFLGYHFI